MENARQLFWIQDSSNVVGQAILALLCIMTEFLIVFLRQMLQIKKLEKRSIDIFQDQQNSSVSKGLQLIEKRFRDLQPPVPPYGVTGESCPKWGTNRVQDEGLGVIVRTFSEGDIFPGVLVDRDVAQGHLFWRAVCGKGPFQ